jgi:hypothetical protein
MNELNMLTHSEDEDGEEEEEEDANGADYANVHPTRHLHAKQVLGTVFLHLKDEHSVNIQ